MLEINRHRPSAIMAHESKNASQDHNVEPPQPAEAVSVVVRPIEPTTQPLNLSWLWGKIKRHKVAEWTLAYIAFSYAFLHGAELLSDAQEWPHVIVRVLSLALILGVPIVATLAWFHGHRAQHRISRVELIILIVLLTCAGAALWHLSGGGREHVATQSTPASAAALPTSAPATSVGGVFSPTAHSVAVLPFTNLSGDPSQEYFSDGVSEEMINALAHIDALEVSARTSSFSFKGQNVDIGTIARRLNVAAILEGSIRRSGKTVRITAQLVSTTNGFHMWSQDYDSDLTNILTLQTKVATAVAQQMQVKLLGDVAARIEAGGTTIPAAYDAQLRGVQKVYRAENAADLRAALADINEAIALDPNYALAHALRALDLLNIIGSDAHTNVPERETLRAQARAAAERAVMLGPQLAEAHSALSSVLRLGYFDYSGGIAEAYRAVALAPGSALAQQVLAICLSVQGHHDAAIAAQQRLVRLDPQNYLRRYNLMTFLYSARRFHAALATAEDARALKPDGTAAVHSVIALSRLALGETKLAQEACESSAITLDASDRHQCLAIVYHLVGRQKDAQAEFMKLQAFEGDSGAFDYATIYAQWGDTDIAIMWFTTAIRLYDPGLESVKNNWMLDPIRGDARFKALEAKMNIPP